MALKQIPNLPVAIALNGTEQMEAVQAGVSVRLDVTNIAQFTQATYPPTVLPVISVGTTEVADGVSGRVLYDDAGVLGELDVSGTGSVVLTNSPTLVTPALGTPSAITLTNGTSLPIDAGTTGTLPATRGGTAQSTYSTGDILYASGTNTLAKLTAATDGYVLTLSSGIPAWAAVGGTGTVTQVSVVTANGFAGTVATDTTTPAITLTTSITGILQGNGTAISAASTTGSGNVVLSTSPTLVTPALGTPSALVLANATGLPIAGITGLGANVGTFLATPSSANLAAAVTDETGSGALVFATSPTLVTPALGAATATSINGLTLTSSTGALTIANGKTLTASNTLTFTGTDSSSVAFGGGGTVVYTGAITTSGLTQATARMLGRTTGSTGAVEEITVSTGLTFAATTLAVDKATASNIWAGTSNKVITADGINSALAIQTPSGSSNWAPDFSAFATASWVVDNNRELSNPTNVVAGQTKVVTISASSGTRTISFGANYRNVPTITDVTTSKGYTLTLYATSTSTILITSVGYTL